MLEVVECQAAGYGAIHVVTLQGIADGHNEAELLGEHLAVGRGGPLDIVDASRTGWLYRPGDLGELRERVKDLVYDDIKRRAFAEAAFQTVQGRTWPVLCEQLVGYYEKAVAVQDRRRTELARRLLAMPSQLAARVFG